MEDKVKWFPPWTRKEREETRIIIEQDIIARKEKTRMELEERIGDVEKRLNGEWRAKRKIEVEREDRTRQEKEDQRWDSWLKLCIEAKALGPDAYAEWKFMIGMTMDNKC